MPRRRARTVEDGSETNEPGRLRLAAAPTASSSVRRMTYGMFRTNWWAGGPRLSREKTHHISPAQSPPKRQRCLQHRLRALQTSLAKSRPIVLTWFMDASVQVTSTPHHGTSMPSRGRPPHHYPMGRTSLHRDGRNTNGVDEGKRVW